MYGASFAVALRAVVATSALLFFTCPAQGFPVSVSRGLALATGRCRILMRSSGPRMKLEGPDDPSRLNHLSSTSATPAPNVTISSGEQSPPMQGEFRRRKNAELELKKERDAEVNAVKKRHAEKMAALKAEQAMLKNKLLLCVSDLDECSGVDTASWKQAIELAEQDALEDLAETVMDRKFLEPGFLRQKKFELENLYVQNPPIRYFDLRSDGAIGHSKAIVALKKQFAEEERKNIALKNQFREALALLEKAREEAKRQIWERKSQGEEQQESDHHFFANDRDSEQDTRSAHIRRLRMWLEFLHTFSCDPRVEKELERGEEQRLRDIADDDDELD